MAGRSCSPRSSRSFVYAGSTAGAQTADPADVAVDYLRANAAAFGLTDADVSDVLVKDQVPSAHTGVTHVYLQQRAPGHPGRQRHRQRERRPRRHRAQRRQPVRRRPRRGHRRAGPGPVAIRSPVQATAAAARHVGLTPTERLVVVDREPGPARETTVSDGGISQTDDPGRVGVAAPRVGRRAPGLDGRDRTDRRPALVGGQRRRHHRRRSPDRRPARPRRPRRPRRRVGATVGSGGRRPRADRRRRVVVPGLPDPAREPVRR